MPELLETAIMKNDWLYVEHGLNQFDPVPANCANEALQTGLMIASQHNSVKTVEVFLKTSTPFKNDDPTFCNVNHVDASGWTALHYAAQSGSLECVKLLIEHKAEIDATTDKNETAVYLATEHNHPDIVEYLAENNCQLKTEAWCEKDENSSIEKKAPALELAVKSNFEESAKCLLFHLTRVKGLNEEELSNLLIEAAVKGDTKIASELLISGASLNKPDNIMSNIFNYMNCIIYSLY
jgi:ankyrin repeat protein